MEQCFAFTAHRELRLDRLVSEEVPGVSRSMVQTLMESGLVLVNGRPAGKSQKAKIGDQITLTIPSPEPIDVIPENIPLDIIYEDDSLLVVNKGKGMVVHPAPGNYTGTMVNALLFHAQNSLSGINGKIRPGIVHRIDKDTSGLLIVAKNDQAHNALAQQIKEHSFTREYRAVVYGGLKDDTGVVDAPIGRNPKERKQMAVLYHSPSAREARTHYTVLERFRGYTLLSLRLETGRTHQIRVHMASIGHPVAGDPLYGPKKVITELKGQCLHAGLIGFIHPVTGDYMEFTAPLPKYFTDFLQKLNRGEAYG